MVSPLIVALDFPEIDTALPLARKLRDDVAGFKVGLELLMAEGPRAIEAISELDRPVFADAKLHDIPNTVAGAARRLSDAGARWVTVHAQGGLEMMVAAKEAMAAGGILAVTVLTALGPMDLEAIGIMSSLEEQVLRLRALAESADVEGLVCAPGEVALVKRGGTHLTIFVPGIRPESDELDDQKRVATPHEAMAAGADYLVVGRPITRAPDPLVAAREIASSLGDSA